MTAPVAVLETTRSSSIESRSSRSELCVGMITRLLVEDRRPSQPTAIHARATGARGELAQRLDRERIGLHPADGREELLEPVISTDETEREVLGIDAQ